MDIRKCEYEGCNNTFIAGYGYSLSVCWLVTGHALVPAFACDLTNGTTQHWGCTPEHAFLVAKKCLEEHMSTDVLMQKHAATGQPRYSIEDEWAKGKGNNFHLVEIKGGGV